MIKLQQAEAARVLILIGVELQTLRIVQRTRDPFAAAGPHRQPIAIVNLRMIGIAHATLIGAAAEHTGHRRDAQLTNFLTRAEVVFHLHHHALRLAVNNKFVGAGYAWTVQQRISGKGGLVRFRRLKPEGDEVRKFFVTVAEGVYRHAARGKAVLISVVHRAEVAGAKERDDIAPRQLRFFKRAKAGKAKVGFSFQLFGIDLRIAVIKQLGTKVNFARLAAVGIHGKHADAAFKAHTDMKELHVQLTIGYRAPQGVIGIVLNGVVRLRRHVRQRIGQRSRRAAPGLFCQRGGFLFQYVEIKAHGGAVGYAVFSPGGLRKQGG